MHSETTGFSRVMAELNFDDLAYSISGAQAFQHSMVPDRAAAYAGQTPPDANDVRAALARARSETELSPLDLRALLSPAADAFLEETAELAQAITRKRFGRVVQLYAPMYLSNHCFSKCSYCGFSFGNDIKRLTLSIPRAVEEADLLHAQGIRHILLLTGEAYRETPVEYMGQAIEAIAQKFPSVSIEVYPLNEDDYRFLRGKGLDGLAVYQETYDPVRYKQVHLAGMKSRLEYRLDCPDRAGRAGLRRIAVGSLLGLSDPAADAYCTALHARYLLKQYWQSQIALSLPRLRPAEGVTDLPEIPDREYARYLFAMRLFLPDAGLNLSTRESQRMRDNLAGLVVTHMSAGSRTEPGGYGAPREADEQFSIDDDRSIAEVRMALEDRGLEPVFVDWAPVLK